MPELRLYAFGRMVLPPGLARSELYRMMPQSDDGLVHRLGALALATALVFMGLEGTRTSLLMEAALLRFQGWKRGDEILGTSDTIAFPGLGAARRPKFAHPRGVFWNRDRGKSGQTVPAEHDHGKAASAGAAPEQGRASR
jgi:hypothetical protein